MRARRAREVVEAQPQDDRAPDAVGGPQAAGDAVDECDEVGVDVFRRRRPAPTRPLRPDRAAAAPGLHRARVEVVREGVQVPPRRPAYERAEHTLGQQRDLAARS